MSVVHLGRKVTELHSRQDAREILSTKVTQKNSLYDHIEDVWLGTIAELHPTKCLHVAIEAMAQLRTNFPTLRYLIIHDGQEREQLEKLINNLELSDRVFLLGTIPDAAKLLPALDLFILPSCSEAFGYVLLEAGAAGVPVIATNVGGIPDIITHDDNGLLVPARDPGALAMAVHTVLSSQTLLDRLTKAHTNRASKFTIELMVEETTRIYRGVKI